MAYISVDRKHAGKEEKYIACLDLNFGWLKEEEAIVLQGWKAGLPLWEIAEKVGRVQEEVHILLMDYAKHGKIKRRPGWLYGTAWGRKNKKKYWQSYCLC